MEENKTLADQPASQISTSISTGRKASNHKWLHIFFSIVSIIFLVSTIFLYYQNQQLRQRMGQLSAVNLITTKMQINPTSPPTPTSQSNGWKTAKFGGLFSYEYPADWHVATLWQDNNAQNGIILAMDPKPIDNAPRGGPIATFDITLLNGNNNPDEILQQRMANFNSTNYSNITKEEFDADIGHVYHYEGITKGEMMPGYTAESYFFTFNENPNDPTNQMVAIATVDLNNNSKYSDMLRHIILSFKELPK